MVRVRIHVVAVAASVLVGLTGLLAGCSEDEPVPKMPDSPSTSASESPAASESSTVEPDEETAEEFVRRWVEVNTAMQNTGEVDEFLAISARCSACRQVASRVRDIYAAGGDVRTKGWAIRRIIDTSGPTQPIFDLVVDSAPTHFRESAGAEVENYPGGRVRMRLRLSKRLPWSVVEMTQVAT